MSCMRFFTLFLQMGGVGIHERNPQIQRLAMRLGRTVRSTEAQLLMFRNLEKRGDYSRENMSRLCREIWEEYHNGLR